VLDLKRIDLGGLAYALEDRSDLHSWWLDPATGELELWSLDAENEEETHPDDRGLTSVDPIQPHEAYRDLEDFTSLVRDPRAHDLLERAIEGRGAFRRFKDTLFDFPELREAWHAFHDARMERRALHLLVDLGAVEPEAAEQAMPADPSLPELSGRFDPMGIAGAVAEELQRLYGDNLRQVLLFGARGPAALRVYQEIERSLSMPAPISDPPPKRYTIVI